MIRVMLDSDQLEQANQPVPVFATYSDLVTDAAAFEQAHRDKVIVWIDRGLGDPGGKASVADVEAGAIPIADVAAWVHRKMTAGVKDVTVYSDRADHAAIVAELGATDVFYWIATLDGTADPAGFVPLRTPAAVQCLPAADLGVHGDLSLILEDQWNAAAPSNAVAQAHADLTSLSKNLSDAQAIGVHLAAMLNAI